MNIKEKIAEQYPDCGYTLADYTWRGSKSNVVITCPEHGEFTSSWDNFIHIRGCKKCTGTHRRAYPLKSRHSVLGKIVFLSEIADGVYSVCRLEGDINKASHRFELPSLHDADLAFKVLSSIGDFEGVILAPDLPLVEKVMRGFTRVD